MLEALATCKWLGNCGVWLAWGLKNQLFDLSSKAAGPSQVADQKRSGNLFPLPVRFPNLVPTSCTDPAAAGGIEFATEYWLAVVCRAINAYYGCHRDGTKRKPGKVHAAALGALRGKIRRFLVGEVPHNLVFSEVVEELRSKKVSYCGEEVSPPSPISVDPDPHAFWMTGGLRAVVTFPCLLEMTQSQSAIMPFDGWFSQFQITGDMRQTGFIRPTRSSNEKKCSSELRILLISRLFY